jgi:hypothetical protein
MRMHAAGIYSILYVFLYVYFRRFSRAGSEGDGMVHFHVASNVQHASPVGGIKPVQGKIVAVMPPGIIFGSHYLLMEVEIVIQTRFLRRLNESCSNAHCREAHM